MRKNIKIVCKLLLVICFLGLNLPACGGGESSSTGTGVSGSGK